MNGQSMWSDGGGVKASLQICNIRLEGFIDSASCGWAYFIRDERTGSQVDPDVGPLPSPEFHDGPITAASVADPISGKIRADGALLWNWRSVSEAAGALAAIAFPNHFYRFDGEERDQVSPPRVADVAEVPGRSHGRRSRLARL